MKSLDPNLLDVIWILITPQIIEIDEVDWVNSIFVIFVLSLRLEYPNLLIDLSKIKKVCLGMFYYQTAIIASYTVAKHGEFFLKNWILAYDWANT